MYSAEERLLQTLEDRLPDMKFEGWYPPNVFNYGPFILRAIRIDPHTGLAKTFDVTVNTDSLEPVDSLAESLVPHIERGLSRGPVMRYRADNLTEEQLQAIVRGTLPAVEWDQWFGSAEWVTNQKYNWNAGRSAVAESRLGPLFSVAIGAPVPDEDREHVIAGWYYPSGIVEVDYYPDYNAPDGRTRRIPLEVDQPERNTDILRRAVAPLITS